MATMHDSGYKRLFSNPTIFRQLMESFVDQPWVRQVDFSQAERVDKSFVSEHYKESESDLIYRLPFGKGELYIYILLEFQSTVDRMMALRVLNYVTNFYMDLVAAGKNVRKLPPIFPIVLYNGEGRWSAALDMNDLIEPVPALGDYAPHYRYFKIAENEYSEEQLLGIGNIVSTLFLAESHYDIDLLTQEFRDLFDNEEDKQAAAFFFNWFRQLAFRGYIQPDEYASWEEVYRSSEEVKSMLVAARERERQKIYAEAREEARKEIREEVRKEIREEARLQEEARTRGIALAMLGRGFDNALIADVTSLPLAQVEELAAQLARPNEENVEDIQ